MYTEEDIHINIFSMNK